MIVFLRRITLTILLLIVVSVSKGQEGRLTRIDLFSIPTAKFAHASGYSFKIAIDSKENIAFNACASPYIFIYDTSGVQTDSIALGFSSCVRNLEFDEDDNLLIMDNDERTIYRYIFKYKKLETHPYQKPEDWFKLINHFFKTFDLSTIPTYYSNNDFLQDFYNTRFNYSYNLFLNQKNGFVYQCHYNFIKKIPNHKMYTSLKKEHYMLSDNISIRTKILMINDEARNAFYYDRFYNIIYEDFNTGRVIVNAALSPNSEAARFDYSTNLSQEKIWGISSFNKKEIVISVWKK
jgi:hypothetical protein